MNAKLTTAVAVLAATAAFSLAPAASAQSTQPQGGQATQEAKPEPVRNTKEWNLPRRNKLAINGYDPVAYFPEGGGKAKKGSKKIEFTYKGVTYRFASERNRQLFQKAPLRYEPAHGGWCSWAMASGGTTEANPKSFIVKDDRLFLFYDGLFGDTRKDWLKGDHNQLAGQADREWKKRSREEKRQVAKPES
ncbi:MAG: YHS domain-containing (seleno)protein [Planctomycetota bacterium]